ncbi:hypothetical protein [Photobacterium damselae]|nr:hypothetical protein [Photobacterium damselae]QOQ69372.1 hypothetical protein IL982_03470 [Photobacterium damselae subsp. damselae]
MVVTAKGQMAKHIMMDIAKILKECIESYGMRKVGMTVLNSVMMLM